MFYMFNKISPTMSTAIAAPKSLQKNYLVPLIIIGALFFIFGFVTWINGTLIPYLQIACELKSDTESFLVATAFFFAYFVMAIPSSMLLKKIGYKKGMSLGLLIMAAGAVIFIPAASTRDYSLFLTGLFIIGTGLTLLQTASNPYVSIIGPNESAASRISMMGICNKGAGILASLVFGFIALKDTDTLTERLKTMSSAERDTILNELAARVINPYIVITIVLIVVAVVIYYSSLPDIKDDGTDGGTVSPLAGTKTSIFQFPHLWLGVIAIFLYVGVEVMAGDTIISYGKSLGIPLSEAKYFTSGTLICMLAGYIVGIFAIPKYLSQPTALKICSILGILFSTLAVFTHGYASVVNIALLGLANSLMWPAIFPLAIHGLGRFTKTGSGLLVMGIVGGALFPLLYGMLSESTANAYIGSGIAPEEAKATAARYSYWIMIPCYFYLFFYAVKGYKVGFKK
jgi:MFS transporter, FHS family, L-fucose permease